MFKLLCENTGNRNVNQFEEAKKHSSTSDDPKHIESPKRIDGNNTTALFNKGNALFKLNDFEGAMKAFDRTLEIDPTHARAWYNKACLAATEGKAEEALWSLEKALNLDRENVLTLIGNDFHLDNVRNEPRFKELVS